MRDLWAAALAVWPWVTGLLLLTAAWYGLAPREEPGDDPLAPYRPWVLAAVAALVGVWVGAAVGWLT